MAPAFPPASVAIWATGDHRIGLKPLLKRVWTLPGQRPLAPVEPRYDWRYLVAFVHPASRRTIWHVATGVSADLFSAELAAFAEAAGASPTKQIVLVLDQAGWHTSDDVVVPEHGHLLFLPAHAPELQPCEHRWQFTDAPLLNRHFRDGDELEDVQLAHCAVLQQHRNLIRSATLFSDGPSASPNYDCKARDVIKPTSPGKVISDLVADQRCHESVPRRAQEQEPED